MSVRRQRIAEQWDSYARQVLPKNASNVQRWECRRAFYAGAWGFFQTTMAALDPGTDPTEADMENLGACIEELTQFNERVKAGTA